jgi:hypothetical protein
MQILRLLAARRAASTNASAPFEHHRGSGEDDEGPFFDLDFSSCSLRTSSSSGSDSDSDESCDFIISLQRSVSASPLFPVAAPLKFCASEPPARANSFQHRARKRGITTLRTLSFGARKPAPLYGRPSFARSSSGRRSSFSSACSLRPFMGSPQGATEDSEHHAAEQTSTRAPSRDVIRRCLAKISRRLRTAASPRAAAAEARGLRRLRKCRSESSATVASVPSRCDDSVVEKQDGIAGAIAHCKESIHRGAYTSHVQIADYFSVKTTHQVF